MATCGAHVPVTASAGTADRIGTSEATTRAGKTRRGRLHDRSIEITPGIGTVSYQARLFKDGFTSDRRGRAGAVRLLRRAGLPADAGETWNDRDPQEDAGARPAPDGSGRSRRGGISRSLSSS